ncbi:ergothioneine biosynthesis protein EgtB [Thalassoroseus pseudoceratinae]|uniref:ergothioneine biosynthesis protein EgtB n=1 Tax=Thalassoroseus pseudoceratinae TaxID=2713176 RepID=UPI00141FD725|nr:ergothioneine biosynthesis protein EgtB [Thalassoroseus pseudoceratinae]
MSRSRATRPASLSDPSRIVSQDTSQQNAAYRRIRGFTEQLTEPLSPEDCVVQSMPDASPAKWHLAHTTWFFETFILRADPNYQPYHPQFSYLFNSYYNGVGDRHARPKRGLLTRPSLGDVYAYREVVDDAVSEQIDAGLSEELTEILEIGLNHEQQHQELLLTDVKHLLSCNPILPTYLEGAAAPTESPAPTLDWQAFPEGVREIGVPADTEDFCFDNETPRHRVFLEAFELSNRLITNGEFMRFIEDGGYEQHEYWLSTGWDVVQSEGWTAPLYWHLDGSEWKTFTLGGVRAVEENEPVCHLSYFEADAYARWAGARLPTEKEWEVALQQCSTHANHSKGFVENGRLHPTTASSGMMQQLLGEVWEWTSSQYTAYPGYRPLGGVLGEYNGKFMCDQWVLRGGSCLTSHEHIRGTYRNFFPATSRWQMSGFRLARDC